MHKAKLRMAMVPKCSQRAFADQLQLLGLDVTKNTIQCIESGNRFVADIELKAIAQVLGAQRTSCSQNKNRPEIGGCQSPA